MHITSSFKFPRRCFQNHIMSFSCALPATSSSSKRVRIQGSPSLSTPVRFLILSDTHSAELPRNLPSCDVLLHCGDLTEDGTPESISAALQALGQVQAGLKLVIPGNHDISLDKQYWLSQGGSEGDADRAHALVSPDPSSEASKNGVPFLSEGTHSFRLPGSATFNIYASPYTPTFGISLSSTLPMKTGSTLLV
jgi:hypothetical protein